MKSFLTILLLVSFANCFSAEQNDGRETPPADMCEEEIKQENESSSDSDSDDDEPYTWEDQFAYWKAKYKAAQRIYNEEKKSRKSQEAIWNLKAIFICARSHGEREIALLVAHFLVEIGANN